MIAERCRHILVHVNWPFVMLSTISGKKKNVRARVFCMTVIEIAVKDNQTVFEILFICRRLFKLIEEKSLRTQYHVWCVVRVCSWSVFVLFYYLYINWETSGIQVFWSGQQVLPFLKNILEFRVRPECSSNILYLKFLEFPRFLLIYKYIHLTVCMFADGFLL